MDAEGLSIICTGLGFADEDDNGGIRGYVKSEHCLDNLKDLQRYLRRDDPMQRDVFKQICKWRTVPQDLIPIVEYYQSDRNLVINAVKVLVFLTMPIDPTSCDIAQQMEYMWHLKAAMTRNVVVASIVSLLEDPLDHLERDAFTEDDWKLVQLVLTLFRNALAIQDIPLHHKASGSTTQFLFLRERFLELMFQENAMDIILVLTQHIDGSCGYLHEDNLLLLEIYHYIFLGQDADLIVKASRKSSKADEDVATSVDSLKLMMEEESKGRITRLRNSECHSNFSGMFTRLTMDGSRTIYKGNPVCAGDGMLKVQKIHRGPVKRTAWDYESASSAKENILQLQYDFLNQFLSGGYNALMQSVFSDIINENQAVQNADIIIFFQVAQFAIAFQFQRISSSKKQNSEDFISEAAPDHGPADNLFHGSLCGPIAATVNEAMFSLVISKWRETFEGLKQTNDFKSLSAAGSLIKNMIRMLDTVLKLLPEDSKESHTARVLLYKIFYDQTEEGLTQFLLNLFKSFDTHKQPKSDLADLLEIIHIVLRLMEKLQDRGTLRVSRKSRKQRKKKTKDTNEVEVANQGEDKGNPEKTGSPSAAELSKPDTVDEELGTSTSNPITEPGVATLGQGNLTDDPSHIDIERSNNNIADPVYDTDGSSSEDEVPATYEVDFNISKLVLSFASEDSIRNLCWLLKFYKSNSACTNHYITCMLKRFCDDLDLYPMLYQLSLMTTFHEILAEQKSSVSNEYKNIVDFLSKVARRMLRTIKRQPLLFVEMLFWKTRKECHCINAEVIQGDLNKLKGEIRNFDGEVGQPNDRAGSTYKSMAESLGDDEADVIIQHNFNDQRLGNSLDDLRKDFPNSKRSVGSQSSPPSMLDGDSDKNGQNEGAPSDPQGHKPSKRQKGFVPVFDQEQEDTLRLLYAKYKDDARCNRLIAEAMDPDGKITAVHVSAKLRRLGLKISGRKRFVSDVPGSSNKLKDSSFPETSTHNRKRVRAFSEEQEHEIKVLFERFKDHKKCSHMIANALDGDGKYTAAQVSRKLKNLGLVVPQKKKSSETRKQLSDIELTDSGEQSDEETLQAILKRKMKSSETSKRSSDIELTDRGEQSDEETLLAIKKRNTRKRSKPSTQDTATEISTHETTEQENSVHDDELNRMQIDEGSGGLEAVDSAALRETDSLKDKLNDSDIDEPDRGPAISADQHADQWLQKHNELEDIIDSGDDTSPVQSTRPGSRRTFKMIVDMDDDE
ncbi:timeless protein [Dioscorea alata]|uniref:Timeless protein n=1 Tax=Dioscorea alata TaxID=55571 RepID=A0ACB7TSG8_DIOAL|nr:timeless protein [Dioscorea alata]